MPTIYTRDRDNRLTKFYPVENFMGIKEDTITFDSIDKIPDEIYGKYVS